MPRVLHYKSPRKGGIRVMLATPAYSGLSAAYTYALFASQQTLIDEDINCDFEIMAENCHVDDSRNVLVRDFLETDCEYLVFLDADLRWNPSELVELIKHDQDIVAGIYPLKEANESYPIRFNDGEIVSVDGLIEVEAVPTGFLKMSRKVLQELADDAPGFYGKADTDKRMKVPLIFERTMEDGVRWGGDYTFCLKARDKGYKIYIDPEFTFEHSGEWFFTGCLGDHLRKQNGIMNPKLLSALESLRGDFEDDVFADIYKYWGNEWTASPELLLTCYEVAKQHQTVFECGSGVSTLVMGMTGVDVIAYESNYLWYEKLKKYLDVLELDNVDLVYSHIKDYGEYRWFSDLPPIFDMALVDGPVRDIGRDGFFQLANYDQATLLIDDMYEMNLEGRESFSFGHNQPFVISRPACLKKSA